MNLFKWAALGVLSLTAFASASAQQKFPMRAGEWTATMADPTPNQPPVVLLYCLNDEMWTKALTQDPTCSVSQLSVTLAGASYNLSCPGKTFQMTGRVNMTFDGKTHIVAKASLDMTLSGKTTHLTSQTDFRWTAVECNPKTDMNLRDFKKHP